MTQPIQPHLSDQDPLIRGSNPKHALAWPVVAGLAAGVMAFVPSSQASAENPKYPNGSELSFWTGGDGDDIEMLTLTAVAPERGGYATLSSDGNFGETASLNYKKDKNTANTTFTSTDPAGNAKMRVGGEPGNQSHFIVDSRLSIDANGPLKIFKNPIRLLDTGITGQRVLKDGTIEFSVGRDYAGKVMVLNLGVGGNRDNGYHALYPCSERYQGTASLNASPGSADSITAFAKVDAQGLVCLKSGVAANRAVVDALGYFDADIAPNERIADTRVDGGRLRANIESSFHIGEPNTPYLLTVAAVKTAGRGWFDVYSGEYEGTSLANFDGKAPAAGMVIVVTDSAGNANVLSSVAADVVIDGVAVPQLDGSIKEGEGRLISTRDGQESVKPGDSVDIPNDASKQPFVLGDQEYCDRAAWIEYHEDLTDPSKSGYAYAVYDESLEEVLRYEAATEPLETGLQMDPIDCDTTALYGRYRNDGSRSDIYKRDFKTGNETRIVPAGRGIDDASKPDGTYSELLFIASRGVNSVVESAQTGDSLRSAVEEFSINDSGSTFATISRYQKSPDPTKPLGNYTSLDVIITNDADQQQYYRREVEASSGEILTDVQVSADGEDIFVRRAVNGSYDFNIYRVKRATTVGGGFAKPTPITFERVVITGINTANIGPYRLVGGGIMIATMPDSQGNPETYKIETRSGAKTLLTQDTPDKRISLFGM